MAEIRKILHIDMDAFFAAIEVRDNPALRGKAVVVGGSPNSRGVVATASYEARKFGIHSAMPSAQAARRAPHAIFLKPRFETYREASKMIKRIFLDVTDLVEMVSIDEAYLDVTKNYYNEPSATKLAQVIKHKIKAETELTASAGVSCCKFLAKIASGMQKPDGLTVIAPQHIEAFLLRLDVRQLPGVGAVTERKLNEKGIRTVADLRQLSQNDLISAYGKHGAWLYALAWAKDERPVEPERLRKSVGVEETYAENLRSLAQAKEKLATLSQSLEGRLAKHRVGGRTLTLKITYADFKKQTRSKSLAFFIFTAEDIYCHAVPLLEAVNWADKEVRLLGLSLNNLGTPGKPHPPKQQAGPQQLSFFPKFMP